MPIHVQRWVNGQSGRVRGGRGAITAVQRTSNRAARMDSHLSENGDDLRDAVDAAGTLHEARRSPSLERSSRVKGPIRGPEGPASEPGPAIRLDAG
jgi:hypothetical protein